MVPFPLIALALGLVLGSFYNVCIHRYLTGQSVVLPASHCPRCRNALSWWENIPLISFIVLRGRCRACKQAISWRYPIVEAVSGIWALLLAIQFGPGWEWLLYMVAGGLLIIMSFIDFQEFILPDVFTYPGAVLAFAGTVLVTNMPWVDSLLGAVIGAGLFWILQKGYYLLRGVEGLGTGDIKLMLMLGALVGWQGLPMMIFLAAFTALVASLAYMAKNAHQGMLTRIPFGPFLSLGAMLQILYGPVLMRIFLPMG
ncbi:prepilin peptidase [Desulfonatronum thioautotrophicum]|uniref:prepilin peptidase n=1 Tax=Desulfonatronum thioautotrophicum TaxID=617001 RepID=UPI0005EB8ABF|nr:A24 family peptidase [Desulfonatronum thioautotrophicum]